MDTGGDSAASKGSIGRYYDFDDVQVPSGMELQSDESLLFKVGDYKAGLLVLSDRVEMNSLVNFFQEAMIKDNWTLKSTFKYPKAALFFAKPGKTCIISINEGTFSTRVEIWVAPGQ
jgi:hypothetical protein